MYVSFHADGGQACIGGLRTFTNTQDAIGFAQHRMEEPGHFCGPSSVKIFLTDKEYSSRGELDLRSGESTLEQEVTHANAQEQNKSLLDRLLHR